MSKTGPIYRFIRQVLTLALISSISSAAMAVPVTALPTDLLPTLSFDVLDAANSSTISNSAPPALLNALEIMKTGDIDTAIGRIREYLEIEPGSAAGHELLGAALAINGDTGHALDELHLALKLNPQQSTAQTKIGDIYMSLGQFDKARAAFESAQQIDPSDRLNYQRLGYLDELAGNFQSAVSNYEKGIKGMPPDIVGIKLRLASLYNTMGNFDKAAGLLEPLVDMDTKDPAAHLVLGASYLGQGHVDDAIKRFMQARAKNGNEARVSLSLGIAYRDKGDLATSLDELNRAVKAAPDWETAYFQKGETEFAMKQYEPALVSYRKAESLNEKSLLVRQRIAETLSMMNRHDEAESILSALVDEADPADTAYIALLDRLATSYRNHGKLDKAEATYKRMIKVMPNSGFGFHKLASYYGFQRRYTDAISTYKKGLDVAPDDRVLIKGLSLAYSRTGDHDDALAMANRLVKLNPNDVNAVVYAAVLQENAGHTDEAVKGYEAALAMNPKAILALNNLAMIRSRQGDYAGAMKLVENARSLSPNNGFILDTYAWVLYNKGDLKEAEVVLKRAVKLAPENPTIQYHLGVVYQALENDTAARDTFKKALELSGGFAEAADTKARLLKLGN
jgi:tetratricopeptide (TPR) repeat protein